MCSESVSGVFQISSGFASRNSSCSEKKTQKGCGGRGGENPGAFLKAGPIIHPPSSLPEVPEPWQGESLAAGKSGKNFPAASERLSGPISRDTATLSLRYPLSRDTFSATPAIPQQGAIPPFGAFFTRTYQCDIPICNISRDTCAMPQENKHEKVLRYYR